MYNVFQKSCERLLRIPPPPEPPPGDETTARIFTAAPNFFRYLTLIWALGSLFSLVIVLVAVVPVTIGFLDMQKHHRPYAALLFIIPALVFILVTAQRLFAFAILRLDFDKRWYVVTDRSLRIREGVLTVKEMTITFANIQNISISQGPIQRALGIADLQVETAGGGGGAQEGKGLSQNLHTGLLRGIANANEVRELIQARIKQLKDTGLGHREEETHPSAFHASPDFIAALNEIYIEAQKLTQAVALKS
jgi:membrane protein YdbS with pleckstrin-like domain